MKEGAKYFLLVAMILGSGVFAPCPNPDGCDPDPTTSVPTAPSALTATPWYTPKIDLTWTPSHAQGTGPGPEGYYVAR